MADQPPPRLRDPLPGRHRSGCNRKKLVHFGGSLSRSYMASNSPPRPCPPEPQVKKGGTTFAARSPVVHRSRFFTAAFPSFRNGTVAERGSTFAARCSVKYASRILIDVWPSPHPSGMAAPVASPVASRPGWADGPQSRIPAPFAGLSFCRHSYAPPNPKQDQGGLSHVLHRSRFRVPCTRRLR